MILSKETCPDGLGFVRFSSVTPSAAEVKAAMEAALSEQNSHIFLQLRPGEAEVRPEVARRLKAVARDTDATILYGSWRDADGGDARRTIAYRLGSIRDDFDFGPAVLVNAHAVRRALPSVDDIWRYAGWYALRLAMTRDALPFHIDEEICTFRPAASTAVGQFDYVDPRHRAVQKEYEAVCSQHLVAIGAWLDATKLQGAEAFDATKPAAGEATRPEASVIIPVRDRVMTVADAVHSALAQVCPFPYNVIVVDNHSTDGTTDILRQLAVETNDPSRPPRLVHIVPDERGLGIGGCWNAAVRSAHCGRHVVQLDSDDLYDGTDALCRIVEAIREQRCVALAGSYRLTDFDLRPLPPGVIDHREWTAKNGMNNALRVNGLGAPRAFLRAFLLKFPLPDTSYGEDYAAMLRASRDYRIGRIYEPLYLCRRWVGNSDAAPTAEQVNARNAYKDALRTVEILARQRRVTYNM